MNRWPCWRTLLHRSLLLSDLLPAAHRALAARKALLHIHYRPQWMRTGGLAGWRVQRQLCWQGAVSSITETAQTITTPVASHFFFTVCVCVCVCVCKMMWVWRWVLSGPWEKTSLNLNMQGTDICWAEQRKALTFSQILNECYIHWLQQ